MCQFAGLSLVGSRHTVPGTVKSAHDQLCLFWARFFSVQQVAPILLFNFIIAETTCGWGVKAGMVRVWVAGKTV